MELHNRYRKDRRSLEKLRKDLTRQSALDPIAVSQTFFDLDDLFLLEKDTVFVLSITTVVVFVLSMLSSASFRIGAYLTITFDVLVLEAAAIMAVSGIHLNHISFIVLIVTIVLSLNSSFQVVHAFVFSARKGVRERMIDAFNTVWFSVVVAGFIATCRSISFGFVYPSLSEVFQRLVPVVSVIGMIHAFFISPPIIHVVLLLQFLDNVIYQNNYDVLPNQNGKSEGVTLQLLNGHVNQVFLNGLVFPLLVSAADFLERIIRMSFGRYLSKGRVRLMRYPRTDYKSIKQSLKSTTPSALLVDAFVL